VKQRLALYQGVVPILMEFSDDAEETFSRAITSLLVSQFVFYHYLINMLISHEKFSPIISPFILTDQGFCLMLDRTQNT
jgi:hypothetical protein